MKFQKGDEVEVSRKQKGFYGSCFSAKILDRKQNLYLVQYATLLKDDESGPLIEIVQDDEVRPPNMKVPVGGFEVYQKVDAFEKDGWWVGRVTITGLYGGSYLVFFDVWNVEICYFSDDLRVHQDWVEDDWVISKKFD